MAAQTGPPESPTPQNDLPPPTPAWVKWLALAALLLVVTVFVLHLAGSGFGPGMHGPVGFGPPQ
jgi:hypothetical protein